MLTGFRVEHFKAFSREIHFRLDEPGNYEFNDHLIQDGIITKAMIYGFNGCGKSALGLALFDIVIHITDYHSDFSDYIPYHNLDTAQSESVSFEYCFRFHGSNLVYSYQKTEINALVREKLVIDDREVLSYDYSTNDGFVSLDGTQTLSLKADGNRISRVKYVKSNAILSDNHENRVFNSFMSFVDEMLLFYSLDKNRYRGFMSGSESIPDGIINAGRVRDFEKFLRDNNIDMHLRTMEIEGEKKLMAHFNNMDVDFYKVASTGTRSLALFYYWCIKMENASLVFMDEFDAFYHYELARNLVETVKPFPKTQIIFTTHNTDLISNDILRPDCYFWLHEGQIDPLCRLTEKELRRAHNLQKMFKAGAFR